VGRVALLLQRAEFKRRQAAPALKVSGRAFGSGWRMPIAAVPLSPGSRNWDGFPGRGRA
jgi:hypothetical protein